MIYFLEYKSRLHVGLPGSRQLEFSGGISRQYVGLKDPSYLRFFAAKTNTRLKNVYASFGKEEPQSLIKGAKFDDNYVVVYNSVDESKNKFSITMGPLLTDTSLQRIPPNNGHIFLYLNSFLS